MQDCHTWLLPAMSLSGLAGSDYFMGSHGKWVSQRSEFTQCGVLGWLSDELYTTRPPPRNCKNNIFFCLTNCFMSPTWCCNVLHLVVLFLRSLFSLLKTCTRLTRAQCIVHQLEGNSIRPVGYFETQPTFASLTNELSCSLATIHPECEKKITSSPLETPLLHLPVGEPPSTTRPEYASSEV